MQRDALSLREVNAFYGESHALCDLSFAVREGSVTALLGRNGAGKTTALHAIMGFHPVRSGDIQVFGRSVSNRAPEHISRRGVALVPQGRRVFRSLSVQEHLDVARHRRSPRYDAEALFGWFPRLKERRSQLAGALSGGEQQMLAMARALITDPSVLLLDEPSEGLAPRIVDEIASIIARLRADRLSIVLVEQNTRFALGLADDITILSSGRVVIARGVDDVRSDGALLNRHLGLH